MEDFLQKQGAVSWTELATTDPDAAKEFYSKIFGWDFEEMNMGMGPYHVIRSGGREIGGIMKTPPNAPANMPPTWMSYVTVDNVDETAKKIESAGGKILMPAMDIPEVGRMVVFQDPQGAMISAISYVKKD